MDYYIDQEFHEYFKKPISWLPTIGKFNKPYHTIELISIGIVAEDGREYYAVCNEFDVKAAYNKYDIIKHRNYGDSRNISEYRYERKYWLRENVLKPIFFSFYKQNLINLHYVDSMSLGKMKDVIKSIGKSKKDISLEVVNFIDARYIDKNRPDVGFMHPGEISLKQVQTTDLAFYGYYADYDWVLFCSLFGTMMDLPKGFPKYCKDLKQMIDEKAETYDDQWTNGDETTETKLSWIKNKNTYPKQTNEHHALADAKWNMELHKFLKTIKD